MYIHVHVSSPIQVLPLCVHYGWLGIVFMGLFSHLLNTIVDPAHFSPKLLAWVIQY